MDEKILMEDNNGKDVYVREQDYEWYRENGFTDVSIPDNNVILPMTKGEEKNED